MEEFTPRPYQIDLFEKALANNSIIYLPTGSGKTYIAVMLIKAMSESIRIPYSQKGKRTIFAVNTVPLVAQQSAYITRHTDLTCQGYSGDMNVDFWSRNDWEEQFDQYQVLVLTAQIFLDILTHGYMPLDRVNLIIFDECHRAVHAHPMRQIMQAFEPYPEDKHPRVLGMSATLINSDKARNLNKIHEIIHELEVTFHSTVISVGSSTAVKKYGKPVEHYVTYCNLPKNTDQHINEIFSITEKFLASVDLKEYTRNDQSSREFQTKSRSAKLTNLMNDVKEHIDTQGFYGGSKAVLFCLLRLEKMKKSVDDLDTLTVLTTLMTQMTLVRHIISLEMERNVMPEFERMATYSSDKILKLLLTLKHYNAISCSENSKFCTIVFVRRRFTAQILYHLLKNAAECNSDYKFIKPDYVVGFASNPFKNTCEDVCISKWNKEALIRFRTSVSNCLIATDVVDEGVDIPFCSLIVRYDLPMDYRSYVQSKGRARSTLSNYVMMLSSSDGDKEKERLNSYRRIETLTTDTIGKGEDRIEPIPEELQNLLYNTEIKPYTVIDRNGIIRTISEIAAVSLLFQYCQSLVRSKFILCSPTLKLYKGKDDQYQVSIQLPMASPMREIVFGDVMSTKTSAKRSAAMKTCIKLHQMHELNDRLLPRDTKDIIEDATHLLVNWEDEADSEEKNLIGTYSLNRPHKIIYPEELFAAFPSPNSPAYLHVIVVKPSYGRPYEDKKHREQVFYDDLNDPAGFAILSSKKMSNIPGFPLFMNIGSLDVRIRVNHEEILLNDKEIAKLKKFHWVIFNEVLKLVKRFTIFDNMNLENNYLVVPLNCDCKINWDVVNEYHEWNTKSKQSGGNLPHETAIESALSMLGIATDREPININYDNWQLVEPNYRETIYIVTRVCHHMNPLSTFPTDDFRSYTHYYAEKYGLQIKNPNQPLLEVKAISKNINYIKPRGQALSKRKERENFEEHLIPELCHGMTFPAIYWLKAMTLPSVLHRLSQLLVAEDLRKKIVRETGLGFIEVASGSWDNLSISELNDEKLNSSSSSERDLDEDEDLDSVDDARNGENDLLINGFDQREENSNGPASEPLKAEVDILSLESNVYNWAKDKEPMDLERRIEEVQLIDIEYYYKFVNLHSVTADIIQKKYNNVHYYGKRPIVDVPALKAIEEDNKRREASTGPSPLEIMYVLTTKTAKDAFNLERLETLGDSFLKFITSAYLFEQFPCYTEGRLTVYKGQIVGNRHLYYCGKSKFIPGRLKIDDFEARSNFIPPCFCIPRDFQDLIRDKKKSPNVLYEMNNISDEERQNGELLDETQQLCRDRILTWSERYTMLHTGTENFLGDQIIKDKMISDSVEALIGVYLNAMGPDGATKLVKWLGVLPQNTDIKQILCGKVPSAKIGTGDPNVHMPWADSMEEKLGYKFQDRCLLLQAFTHPSYHSNCITADYQRLEFLGDAIIDFLITIHIYESNNLSPGDLTDLRSALVNNITFACLTVKYGLHTGLLAYAPNLTDAIDKFVTFQEEREHKVGDDLHWILMEEDECNMAEYVEVPKMLGDLFESIIGAIYLDSDKNLQKVWEILYSLMNKEIKEFSKNIPKDPVRSIHETQGAHPKFSRPEIIESAGSVMVPLEVIIKETKKLFHGFGATKKQAKRAAAKQALKFFNRSLQT